MSDEEKKVEAAGAYAQRHEDWQRLFKEQWGIPRFRADQAMQGLYRQRIENWNDLLGFPLSLRERLNAEMPIDPLSVIDNRLSEDGTRKLLLACPGDGEKIETVLIPGKGRMTQCISTQAGCNFRCAFCASGRLGKTRDLTAAEIVGEVMAGCRVLSEAAGEPTRPSNIVVMGMGEPFDNYDNVLRALRVLNDQRGLDIGARHITVSTCGVVPGIERFSNEGLQFELSVSLHAPTQELRKELMPVGRRWLLEELIPACAAYTQKTGRVVTFEYTLIQNLNDTPAAAAQLIRLLRALPCKVNLIPLSPVPGFAGRRPTDAACLRFLDALKKARLSVTMRNSRGRDVDAACGQLRLRRLAAEHEKGAVS